MSDPQVRPPDTHKCAHSAGRQIPQTTYATYGNAKHKPSQTPRQRGPVYGHQRLCARSSGSPPLVTPAPGAVRWMARRRWPSRRVPYSSRRIPYSSRRVPHTSRRVIHPGDALSTHSACLLPTALSRASIPRWAPGQGLRCRMHSALSVMDSAWRGHTLNRHHDEICATGRVG
ncbi:hypothetical protein C2E23DRAFT_860605 [Lenzites betulinus]|nr:hypothetical protein C2E23DRAFT_860605 [Lenzites betulinus]